MATYYYAGIGSRSTPGHICNAMTRMAAELEHNGYTLRSGGALGADAAFEMGVTNPDHMDIFLPWRRFNGNNSPLHEIHEEAHIMAEKFHPAWNRCSKWARMFHARNCYQVLGKSLSMPADFVLCWTPDGAVTGGTGQALRIAQHYNIPIINMFQSNWENNFRYIYKWLHAE
jgi:hypothetical protein